MKPNASDRQKLFLEGPIGTALVRLAIPITLGNLLQTGYQLTDAFWVGRLGAVIMPRDRSQDIDDIVDFTIVEALLEKANS